MQNAGDLAALVAAFFFAAGVCAGVYVLVRLARMISEKPNMPIATVPMPTPSMSSGMLKL